MDAILPTMGLILLVSALVILYEANKKQERDRKLQKTQPSSVSKTSKKASVNRDIAPEQGDVAVLPRVKQAQDQSTVDGGEAELLNTRHFANPLSMAERIIALSEEKGRQALGDDFEDLKREVLRFDDPEEVAACVWVVNTARKLKSDREAIAFAAEMDHHFDETIDHKIIEPSQVEQANEAAKAKQILDDASDQEAAEVEYRNRMKSIQLFYSRYRVEPRNPNATNFDDLKKRVINTYAIERFRAAGLIDNDGNSISEPDEDGITRGQKGSSEEQKPNERHHEQSNNTTVNPTRDPDAIDEFLSQPTPKHQISVHRDEDKVFSTKWMLPSAKEVLNAGDSFFVDPANEFIEIHSENEVRVHYGEMLMIYAIKGEHAGIFRFITILNSNEVEIQIEPSPEHVKDLVGGFHISGKCDQNELIGIFKAFLNSKRTNPLWIFPKDGRYLTPDGTGSVELSFRH
ncbi:hypothetical protein [Thalassospira xiamenensis]|uniref:hypothetical protein n=1 Tax=Thalassospira xiamenensis TaxID=220697 RepID=UPI000DFC0E6E|nr:hypothetical protein [Thalassospira xiamenensis]RCK32234.1 hypothetical protein TH24_22400 [Thalassospira xiamenensis]